MFAQLPMYQRQGVSAYKVDLSNTIKMVSHLDNPETKFKSIHVGGTNGKGSTSHMLASVMEEAGYKVGLYTSPHLKDFRERIRVNGVMISQEYVIDFVENNKLFLEENQLSFFEMTVGLAFQYFAASKVDIAIIEVGLGGRLDSTNIIIPEVSVITNIGLDHTQFLGDTLTLIAAEKAGIIKKNIPVVIGRTTPETKEIFNEKAVVQKSDIFYAEDYQGDMYDSDLNGNYQKENIKTALLTIKTLREKGWNITTEHLEKGFENVVNNTGLLGRWQILSEQPKVICDTAHNEDGLTSVMNQLASEKYNRLHIVLGVVNDKNLEQVLPLFPNDGVYYFAKPDIARGLDVDTLQKQASRFNLKGKSYDSVQKAYSAALRNANNDDMIYIGGSTFVVGEVL